MTRFRMLLVITALCVPLGCSDPLYGDETRYPGDERIVWRARTPQTFGGIAMDAERYYVGNNANALVAIDRKTRKVRWTAATGSTDERFLVATIVLAAGNVVIGAFDLFAFDPATGAPKWRYHPSAGFGPGIYGLATDGATVFAGSASGDVFAIDAATGTERWRAHLSDVPQTSVADPVVRDGSVYVGYKSFSTNPVTGGVAAIDAASGAVLWNRIVTPLQPAYGSGTTDRIVVSDAMAIVGNADGRVIALDRTNGATRWETPRLPELQSLNDFRPAVAVGDLLVAGSTTGILSAYDLSSGALRWRDEKPVGAIVFPLVADSRLVYINDLTGNLLAVTAATGATNWLIGQRLDGTPGPFRTQPLLVGDTVVVPGYEAVYGVLTR